jgi:small subunit ribosomal protein S11
MGKKKVTTQSSEEILKEGKAVASASAPKAATGKKRKVEQGKVYINASYNNTVVTVTDTQGNVVAWASSGSLGFSGPKKATPFASSKIIAAIAEKTQSTGPRNIQVIVKGIGSGRDSAIRSLINQGFEISSIKDVTPVPHNGPRPVKVRRV